MPAGARRTRTAEALRPRSNRGVTETWPKSPGARCPAFLASSVRRRCARRQNVDSREHTAKGRN
jgi:hypothetical protein